MTSYGQYWNAAGNTLSRAGTSARYGLSTFFGISRESRDIWSGRFKQRVNQNKVGLTLKDEREAMATLSRRLSLKRSTRAATARHSALEVSPETNRDIIELEDDVFLRRRGEEDEDLISDKEEALECYRRMIERSKTPLTSTDSGEWFGVNTLVRIGAPELRSPLHPPRPCSLAHNVKVQLESLPVFVPWFIYLVTLAQVVLLCFMLWSFNGIHTIGIEPFTTSQNNTPTVRSSYDVVTRTVHPNMWLGPDEAFLIKFGAQFSPCMREDHAINIRYTSLYNGKDTDQYVCCQFENINRNWVGYTTRRGCEDYGIALSTTGNCTVFTDHQPMYTHKFRPCCVNSTGGCILTSQEHCLFLRGYWQDKAEMCSQVNCLSQVCGLGGLASKSANSPYIAEANQWYRLISAIFIHAGVIHLIPSIVVQLILGSQIEKTAGWFRIMLIYCISGVGGNLTSSVFVPYQATCGSGGAVYGLLGVILVEFIQSYQIVQRPGRELAKLLIVILLSLMVGTLPYLDNFAHLGGMIYGVLSAYLFLPYITFGSWDSGRKVCQIVVALLLIIFLFIVSLVAFYIVQGTGWCKGCYYINCIPYSSSMCKNTFSVL